MSALLSSPLDAASNRTKLAASIGASADFVTEFSYDNLQRMTGIQQHGASGGNAVAGKRIDLAYNAAGQFSAISRFANIASTQAVATSDFVYDGTGRLVALTHAQGTSTLADYSWSFDAGNRLTQFTSLHDGIADYSYGDRGQLTGSQYDYQSDESYSYDDLYAVTPHGNQYTAVPGGDGPTITATFDPYDGSWPEYFGNLFSPAKPDKASQTPDKPKMKPSQPVKPRG